jgi:hypothetical protein
MCRIRNNLTHLYAKDITPDDKQELDEVLQREVHAWFLIEYMMQFHLFAIQMTLWVDWYININFQNHFFYLFILSLNFEIS